MYRNCTQEAPVDVDNGLLNVDATVIGTRINNTLKWGWISGPDSGSIIGPGTSGSTGGGGGGSSSTATFVPYNAPIDSVATGLSTTGALTKGQVFTSSTGATYVWDGKSWCIAIAEVQVKGQGPTNPTNGQFYIYTDPQFGYATVYEYISGRWTIPMVVGDQNTAKINVDPSLNKCYADLTNLALKSGLNSYINKQMNQLFGASDRNLTIKSGPVDGGLARTKRIATPNGNSYEITFDPTQLGNASQEFIASVLAHELAHVLVDEYDQSSMVPLTLEEEHTKIFEDHVDDIAELLKVMFPDLGNNATALALGGLVDVTKDQNGNFRADKNAYALKEYGISLAAADAIVITYEAKGSKGTKCP
ncbi:hypothetical protein GCM10028808_14320 [Spirosoma migulaei]